MGYDFVKSSLYELFLNGRRLKLPKKQVVSAFDDSSKIHLIESGYVQRYLISRDGSKGVQAIFGPCDIFPVTSTYKTAFDMSMYSGPEQYFFETATEVEIRWISQDMLRDAIERNPLIYKDLFYAAGMRLNLCVHRLEDEALKDPYCRVAHLLVYYAERFSEQTSTGIKILMPRRQQDLAEILSLRRETVNRAMSRLRRKGLIITGRNFVIPNLDLLKAQCK